VAPAAAARCRGGRRARCGRHGRCRGVRRHAAGTARDRPPHGGLPVVRDRRLRLPRHAQARRRSRGPPRAGPRHPAGRGPAGDLCRAAAVRRVRRRHRRLAGPAHRLPPAGAAAALPGRLRAAGPLDPRRRPAGPGRGLEPLLAVPVAARRRLLHGRPGPGGPPRPCRGGARAPAVPPGPRRLVRGPVRPRHGAGTRPRRRQFDGTGLLLWAAAEVEQVAQSDGGPRAEVLRERLAPLITTSVDTLLSQTQDGAGMPPVSPDYWERRERSVTLWTMAAKTG